MDSEATPTLAPVPGVDLEDYKQTLIERFANPQIQDTIARLCAESSDRIPKFLLPVIRAQLATGGEIRRSAAVVASWARYAEGTGEQGQPIEVVDRRADRLIRAARSQHEDPLAFIADQDLFGKLAEDQRFTAAYTRALASLHQRGARATLQSVQNKSFLAERTLVPHPRTRPGSAVDTRWSLCQRIHHGGSQDLVAPVRRAPLGVGRP